MGIIDDTLIFSAYDEVSGRELWKTDGTADGTTQVAEIFPAMRRALAGLWSRPRRIRFLFW